MPTILVINDDGIQSIGLIALKKRLEKLGNVIVVAPEEERSGIGKALTTDLIKIVETRLKDCSFQGEFAGDIFHMSLKLSFPILA